MGKGRKARTLEAANGHLAMAGKGLEVLPLKVRLYIDDAIDNSDRVLANAKHRRGRGLWRQQREMQAEVGMRSAYSDRRN